MIRGAAKSAIPSAHRFFQLCGWSLLIAALAAARPQEPSPDGLMRSAIAAARTGSFDKAQPLFISALEAARTRAGRDDLAVSNVLHEYGLALRTAGQFSEAADVLLEALAIRDRELPADSPLAAFTAAQLAWAQFALQRNTDALATNERSIAILERQRTPRHTVLASQIGLQGRILVAQDNLRGAAHEFERGIDVLQKDAPPDTRLMAQFYWLLGGVRARLGSGDELSDAYEIALQLDRQTPSLNDAQRSEAEFSIAASERAAGEPRQAIERLLRALSIYGRSQSGNPRLEASICAELAQAYHELGEYPEAEAMYLRTVTILKANGAEETASFQSITEALAALYRAQGKFTEAEGLLRPD